MVFGSGDLFFFLVVVFEGSYFFGGFLFFSGGFRIFSREESFWWLLTLVVSESTSRTLVSTEETVEELADTIHEHRYGTCTGICKFYHFGEGGRLV